MFRPFDDDDDYAPPPSGDGPYQQVGVAVAIAALTALTTKLVEWGVDELRDRYGTKPKAPEQKSPTEKPPQ